MYVPIPLKRCNDLTFLSSVNEPSFDQFETEEGLWTSPNEPFVPSKRPIRPTSIPTPLPSVDLLNMMWDMQRYPYAPFIHKSPFFGPLMFCFSTPLNQIPLKHDAHGWHLLTETAKSWKLFEHTIRRIASDLKSYFCSLKPGTKIFWDEPDKPGEYGYFDATPTEQEFRKCLSKSTQAFAVYAAYLSFLVALCRFCPFIDQSLSPKTLHELFSAAKVQGKHSPEYITALFESGIGNFVSPQARIGVLVHVATCEWSDFLQAFIPAGVPVWLFWGKSQPSIRSGSWVSAFLPDRSHKKLSDMPTPENHVRSFPPVERGSDQLPGETCGAFFARRRKEDLSKVYSDAQIRDQKAKTAQMANQEQPGRRSKAAVFLWEDVDGFLIRKKLTKSEVAMRWFGFRKSQRRYDPFRDQWDLCDDFEFNPNEHIEPEYTFDYKELDEVFGPTSSEHNSSNLSTQHNSPVQASMGSDDDSDDELSDQNDDQEAYTNNHKNGVIPPETLIQESGRQTDAPRSLSLSALDYLSLNPVAAAPTSVFPPESVEDLVYFRFGFNFNEKPYPGLPRSVKRKPNPFNHWGVVCRAVGGSGRTSSASCHAPITDFLLALHNAENPLEDVPSMFWDLGSENRHPLPAILSPNIRLQHLSNTFWLLRPFSLESIQDTPWCVSVDSATGLECVRRKLGPHSIDLVNFLAKHGYSFNTYLQRPPGSTSPRDSHVLGGKIPFLGFRPNNSFDLGDFSAYQTFRDSFLRSQPSARAALSRGGIVARIAREVLPFSVLHAGPSQEAQTILTIGDTEYVDDQLTTQAYDLICGTYEVATGIQSNSMKSIGRRTNQYVFRSNIHHFLVPAGQYMVRLWPQLRNVDRGLRRVVSTALGPDPQWCREANELS